MLTDFSEKLEVNTSNVASLETAVTSQHEKINTIQPFLSPNEIEIFQIEQKVRE
jgi:hypothetical protein